MTRLLSRTAVSTLLALGILTTATSCVREFDPYWKINKFRVLAIKSDPVTLRPGQVATISALVHAPEGVEVSYAWDWCPVQVQAQNDYACPFSDEDVAALLSQAAEGGQAPPPGLDPSLLTFNLGTASTARLLNPFPAQAILGFCQAIRQQIADATEGSELAGLVPQLDCERGYDITVRLIVQAGGEQIISRKRFTLYTGAEQINENPRLTGIEIRPREQKDVARLAAKVDWIDANASRDDQWYLLPEDEPTTIVAGIPLEVRTIVDPDSVEIWQPPAPRGSEEPLLEARSEVLTFRWFATSGTFNRTRLLYAEDQNTLEEASIARFSMSKDQLRDECPRTNGRCEVKLWNVTRDGRLGIDWIERTLVVVE
jgi:hypothetical protein